MLNQKWPTLKEIVCTLEITFRATISLQRHDLTLSDAFGIWTTMMIHIKLCCKRPQFRTKLAKNILESLERRKKAVFGNPFMACALFLDPRFKRELSKDSLKTEETKLLLAQIWQRINFSETNIEIQNTSNSSNFSLEFDEEQELTKYLNRSANISSEAGIESILDLFDPVPLASSVNVLEFWENSKQDNPELYKLASVIHAIPPTEVQIERDFSKLNFVFGNRRCKLTEERLEDIMILNINPELFFLVKNEELKGEIEKHKLSHFLE